MFLTKLHLPSVTIMEGTVSSLLEEDGCVTGVQYKDKETGDVKVRRGDSVSSHLFIFGSSHLNENEAY